MTNDAYQKLIHKLDSFIRKYYLDKIVKGSLISASIILAFFLIFNLLESQFWFDKSIRKGFFYGFIGISLLSLSLLVGIPSFHYFNLGKVISHEKAARIIGEHFVNVKDKLLNILQLSKQAENNELALASIDQKSADISSTPFNSAIKLSKNRKYLRFLLPIALVILTFLLFSPHLITDSAKRIVNNNIAFEKPAPFKFVIANRELKVKQFEDFHLQFSTVGDVQPESVYLHLGGNRFKVMPNKNGSFDYTFKNVREEIDFYIGTNTVRSPEFHLDIIAKPRIRNFSVALDYPAYTGLKDKVLDNTGDLSVPVGTRVKWHFEVDNVSDFAFRKENEEVQNISFQTNGFHHNEYVNHDFIYTILISNGQEAFDSSIYRVTSIKDAYPQLLVKSFRDSLLENVVFFAGEASDDYGLTDLKFHYSIYRKGKEIKKESTTIPFSGNPTQFKHRFDLSTIDLGAGDNVKYYFEIFDNDKVNGHKSVRSAIMEFRKPTKEEFVENNNKLTDELQEKLKASVLEQKKLAENLKKLQNKLLNQKNMEWQDRKELEKLLEKQQNLQKRFDELKEKFDKKRKSEDEYKEKSPEEKEKEEKLEEMMKKLEENKKMEELLQKLKEMLQDMKKEEAMDKMEEMQKEQKRNEMSTERLEKLLEQLEFEKKVQDQLDKLEGLAEKQEELEEKTRNEELTNDELAKEQEKLNNEFDKVKEKLDELKKESKKLSTPKEMDHIEEQMEDIQREMNEAKENLDKNNSQKASENQKKAKEKMQQMQQQMSSSMSSSAQKQLEEDIETMRQLLENLVSISYDQEEIIEEIAITDPLTPKYYEHTQKQFKLEEDFKVVEDSLIAISQRNFDIQDFVLEKVAEIKENFKKTLAQLEERRTSKANRYQQQAMTQINELALMLSESMENMQQQMAQMKPGNQMCNNPKPGASGKPGEKPMDKITEGQKKLNEQMKKLAEENAKKRAGEKPGEKGKSKKPGEKGNTSDSEGSAKDFAKLAREQSKLKKLLRDMQETKREQGKGDAKLQEIINEMNKTEEDLVNKRITNEMLLRQQDIVTRLLEAENAQREQDQKEERKAEIAEEVERKRVPKALENYLKDRENAIEQLRKVSPNLRPYYKQLVESYYEELTTGK